MAKTKRKTGRWILLFILLILLYEAAGACLPFAFQKTVSNSYKKTVDVPAFYGSGPGRERAGIVETNKGALDTRLAMFREAKKNIIISTSTYGKERALTIHLRLSLMPPTAGSKYRF